MQGVRMPGMGPCGRELHIASCRCSHWRIPAPTPEYLHAAPAPHTAKPCIGGKLFEAAALCLCPSTTDAHILGAACAYTAPPPTPHSTAQHSTAQHPRHAAQHSTAPDTLDAASDHTAPHSAAQQSVTRPAHVPTANRPNRTRHPPRTAPDRRRAARPDLRVAVPHRPHPRGAGRPGRPAGQPGRRGPAGRAPRRRGSAPAGARPGRRRWRGGGACGGAPWAPRPAAPRGRGGGGQLGCGWGARQGRRVGGRPGVCRGQACAHAFRQGAPAVRQAWGVDWGRVGNTQDARSGCLRLKFVTAGLQGVLSLPSWHIMRW